MTEALLREPAAVAERLVGERQPGGAEQRGKPTHQPQARGGAAAAVEEAGADLEEGWGTNSRRC
jgi:hypothetical protein